MRTNVRFILSHGNKQKKRATQTLFFKKD